MAGDYAHIWIEKEEVERDGKKIRTVTVGARTHGCSCCAGEEHPSVRQLEEHIQTCQKDIQTARKAIKVLKKEEARRQVELDKIEAERLAYQQEHT